MNKEVLIDRAKELIMSNPSNGGAILMLKMAVENSTDDLLSGLEEVASQFNDKFSKKDAIRLFGLELCEIAATLFPDTRPHLPINLDEQVKGGKADKVSIEDIAKKFNVSVQKLNKELNMGIKVEMEHTKSKSTAKDIAMDHLTEMPDYYTRLASLEDKASKHWKKKEVNETRGLIKRLLNKAINKKDE